MIRGQRFTLGSSQTEVLVRGSALGVCATFDSGDPNGFPLVAIAVREGDSRQEPMILRNGVLYQFDAPIRSLLVSTLNGGTTSAIIDLMQSRRDFVNTADLGGSFRSVVTLLATFQNPYNFPSPNPGAIGNFIAQAVPDNTASAMEVFAVCDETLAGADQNINIGVTLTDSEIGVMQRPTLTAGALPVRDASFGSFNVPGFYRAYATGWPANGFMGADQSLGAALRSTVKVYWWSTGGANIAAGTVKWYKRLTYRNSIL